MTPTQVTIASGLTTATGVILIPVLRPTLWTSILVTALLVLGYALDSADGQLARLTNRGSLAGEWLDHFFDAIKTTIIHPAVLICWFRFYPIDAIWLVVPIVAGAVGSAFFFGVVAVDLLRRIDRFQRPSETQPGSVNGASVIYSLIVLPADYGLLCLTFLTLWVPNLFLVIYLSLTVVNLMLLVASGYRWHASLRKAQSRGST